MTDQQIQLTYQDKVAVLTMNRPARRNAFDESMFSALETITAELKIRLPRAVVITGSGQEAFSAGFDVNPDNPLVNDFLKAMESRSLDPAKRLVARVRHAVDAFVSLPVPIIAALNGLAYGGGAELAIRCDLRVMDPKAVICFSEVRLGLMPDWGGGAFLGKLLGASVAADLILTARKVPSEEALSIGLVNRISKPGESLSEALMLAGKIAENGPKAVQHALQLIRNSQNLSLAEALTQEADAAASLIATGECLVGVAAFLEGKKPVFPD